MAVYYRNIDFIIIIIYNNYNNCAYNNYTHKSQAKLFAIINPPVIEEAELLHLNDRLLQEHWLSPHQDPTTNIHRKVRESITGNFLAKLKIFYIKHRKHNRQSAFPWVLKVILFLLWFCISTLSNVHMFSIRSEVKPRTVAHFFHCTMPAAHICLKPHSLDCLCSLRLLINN